VSIAKQTGIKITVSHSEHAGFVRMSFFFDIAQGAPSKTFLTNPEIRKIIEERKIPLSTTFGVMSLKVNPKENYAMWDNYFPFASAGIRDAFGKKGIAQLLEYRVVQAVTENFPNVTKLTHEENAYSKARAAQLLKRRLNPCEYSPRESLASIRKNIRSFGKRRA
jgi:predicted GNAT family acetyltransferase